jgi:hypothetical protein
MLVGVPLVENANVSPLSPVTTGHFGGFVVTHHLCRTAMLDSRFHAQALGHIVEELIG